MIHPFHPLCGQELGLVSYRHNWGEDRVTFLTAAGYPHSLPASWTDVAAPDPFVAVAAGRALFRTADLLALVRLCREIAR
ncbi:MAG: DUF5372 family protein [Solirubrobacteraceae bacterium]